MYGNNQVLCGGRFVGGPDARSCIASVVMISAPSVVWLAEVGTFFAQRYSILFIVAAVVLQLASLVLLFATAFSDPGIIPRQPPFNERYDATTKQFRVSPPPRYFDIIIRGHPYRMKYCVTCNVYRPPRCTHCAVCENCIERFDHHCPWIGNCVGKRNYWLFYCFVSSTGALNSYTLATAVAQLLILCRDYQDALGLDLGQAFVRSLTNELFVAILVVYCIGTVWFIVGLCIYHNYLISTNQTTYEQIKGMWYKGHNPFNRGILGNYSDVLFSRVRPRYFDAASGTLLWPRAGKESFHTMLGETKQPMPCEPTAGSEERAAVDVDSIDLQHQAQ